MNRVAACACTLLALILFCSISNPQSQPEDGGLQLRLIIVNPDVCVNAKSLPVEVAVTNHDNEPVAIYKSGFSEFGYTSETREKNTRVTQAHADNNNPIAAPAKDEPPIIIPPHSSVIMSLKRDISASFFFGGDVYSLQIGYRGIQSSTTDKNVFVGHEKSNVALFQRVPCQ